MTPAHYRKNILFAHQVSEIQERDIAEFPLSIVRGNSGFAYAKFDSPITARVFDDMLPGVFFGLDAVGDTVVLGRMH